MPISPQLVIDARTLLKEYEARQRDWQTRRNYLTSPRVPGGVSALDQYQTDFDTQVAEQKRLSQARRDTYGFHQSAVKREANLVTALESQGLGKDANLRRAYQSVKDATAARHTLNMQINREAGGHGSKFSAELRKYLKNGNHEKALAHINDHQLGWLGKKMRTQGAIDRHERKLTALVALVNNHEELHGKVKQAQKAERLVERDTAKALHAMMGSAAGERLIHAGNPQLRKLAAAGDPAADLLLHLGSLRATRTNIFGATVPSIPSAANIRLALHRTGNVSLHDLTKTIQKLNSEYAADYTAGIDKKKTAKIKLDDCRTFADGCGKAAEFEITHNKPGVGRNNMIDALRGLIAGAGVLDDNAADLVLKDARAQKINWAQPTDLKTVNTDIHALANPTYFSHEKLQTSSLPSFNLASDILHGLRQYDKAVNSRIDPVAAKIKAAVVSVFAP